MTPIEAMKLALAYIEANAETRDEHEIADGLRQAIAEAEKQEPVAWIYKPNHDLLWPNEVERKNPLELNEYVPLYTTPPTAQPAQQKEKNT